jgi:hypothetical protein
MRRPTSRLNAALQRNNPLGHDSGGPAKGPTKMSAVNKGQEEASRLQPFTLPPISPVLDKRGSIRADEAWGYADRHEIITEPNNIYTPERSSTNAEDRDEKYQITIKQTTIDYHALSHLTKAHYG